MPSSLQRIVPGQLVLVCSIIATLTTVAIVLSAWRLFPIYPDEIGARMLSSRAFFDGFERVGLMPFCGPETTVRIPVVFYPAAIIFASYTLFEDLAFNRAIAITIMVAGFVILWRAQGGSAVPTGKDQRGEHGKYADVAKLGFCMTALMCCLGVLPATYLILRSETVIYILAPLLILCFSNFRFRSAWATLTTATLILLLFMMAVYQHPKYLYLAPAIGLSFAVLLCERSRWLLAIFLLGSLWIVVDGFLMHRALLLNCPGNPEFEAMLQSFNIDPSSIFMHPGTFLQSAWENISIARLMGIAEKTAFLERYDVGYLPGFQKNSVPHLANALIKASWLLLAVITAVAIVWLCTRVSSLSRRRDLSSPQGPVVELLCCAGMLSMYLAVTVHLLLNKTSWWYDCANWFYLYTLLSTSCLIWMATSREGFGFVARSARLAICGGFLIVFAAATTSAYISNRTFLGLFRGGFSGPSTPIAKFDSRTSQTIKSVVSRCGLSPTSPRIVIDDLTYPFLEKSYKPIAVSYAMYYLTKEETIAKAKVLGSAGMVVRCPNAALFPMLSFAEEDGVCCAKFAP